MVKNEVNRIMSDPFYKSKNVVEMQNIMKKKI